MATRYYRSNGIFQREGIKTQKIALGELVIRQQGNVLKIDDSYLDACALATIKTGFDAPLGPCMINIRLFPNSFNNCNSDRGCISFPRARFFGSVQTSNFDSKITAYILVLV